MEFKVFIKEDIIRDVNLWRAKLGMRFYNEMRKNMCQKRNKGTRI